VHTKAGAQLASQYLQGGPTQSTAPGDPSPDFEDYCMSYLLRRKQKGVWPETLAWTPLSHHLQSTSQGHGSTLHQDASYTYHLPAMASANICAKRWWIQDLGSGKVTGQLLGTRASPRHQMGMALVVFIH